MFDTDDLVFEPELAGYFAFMADWPADARQREIEGFEEYRQTLQACDRATVSTEPLAEYVRGCGAQARVVFNAVSEEMIRLADSAIARSPDVRSGGNDVTIGYLSGTRTHNRDFLEAAEAIRWALDRYSQVRLLIVGKLDLDERFALFGSRVTKIPLQPWRALPELLSHVDINLAPLEANNPVTECKSCVKYLEAGLLGVPTVASPTPDFVRATQGGRTGNLAADRTDWQEALVRLVESPALRHELGALAREDVLQNHTTRARAGNLRKTLEAFGVPM